MSVQITRTVTEHVNLGSYEWAEYSATITAEFDDADNDLVATFFRTVFDRLLRLERERYRQLTTEDNSVLHAHPALSRRPHGDHAPTPRAARP